MAEEAEVTWESEGCLRTVSTLVYCLILIPSLSFLVCLLHPHFRCKGFFFAPDHTHKHSVGLRWTRDRPVAQTFSFTCTTQNIYKTNIHDTGEIRTRNPRKRTATFLCLRPRGHRDQTFSQQQTLTIRKNAPYNFSKEENHQHIQYSDRIPMFIKSYGFTRKSRFGGRN
jgi:hypothetical protein